ncbi:MAG: FAD-binding oxidoreductase, partial [Planifilum sp.]
GRAAKSSSGYHLTGLFVGSEGTLGVFTELTLRVFGIPEAIMAARAVFPTVEQAVNAAVAIISSGIPVARIELVDALSMKYMNEHSETCYPVAPTLFLEFHGNEEGLKKDVAFAEELAKGEACQGFQFETDTKARAKLWESRHQLAYAFIHRSPGKKLMVTDVCVPMSELAGAVEHARNVLDQAGMEGGILGHIGDGNYHVLLMIDPADPRDVEKAEAINAAIVEYALSRGGTCTGEHGVGVGKIRYQRREHQGALDVMMDIKQGLDPKGILNPGKKLPAD